MLLKKIALLPCSIILCGFTLQEAGFIVTTSNRLFNEPRPIRGVIEDIYLEYQISKKLSDDSRYNSKTNVRPLAYNGKIVLAGQVPTQLLKEAAYQYAMQLSSTKQVLNQIRLGTPTNSWQRIQDWYLTQHIKCKILFTSHIRYHHFLSHVEDGEVFLLGKTDANQAKQVAFLAQTTKGIKQVILCIEPF